MTKVAESIDKLEKKRLVEFTNNKTKIPLVMEKYTNIPSIDIENIASAMVKTKYKHTLFFEAIGTYALVASTNFSENSNRANNSANGIVIAPRSIKSLSAARIKIVSSIPPHKKNYTKEYGEKYSQKKIDESLDWLEENNLVATVHIYDYNPAYQDYRENVYYTTFRNLEGLKHFYSTYAYSDYNRYMKLNKEDIWQKIGVKLKEEYIITEEYCQKMTDTIQ